jgi:DNA-binding FadR family transcriptional regulator
MHAAEAGQDDPLLADIAFHVAILEATRNPFYAQLYELVNTALRISIHFTNGIQGHTASLPEHSAVFHAIEACDPDGAREHMHRIVADVLALVQGAQRLAATS